jgi:murein DD-endopeptidase MepM/ murein hydrolase activator NlpD
MRTIVLLLSLTACLPDIEEAEPPGADDSMPGKADDGLRHAIVGGKARVVETGGLGLRLRAAASTTSSVLLVMPEESVVDVVGGPSGPWYRVTYQGTTGWAHGDYLAPIQSPKGANNLLPWTANVAYWVTQGHNGGSHVGAGAWAWDFGTPLGTPIRAAHFGTVRLVKGNSTIGGCSSVYANDANYVIVDQGNGYESLYLHLSSVTVSAGQAVNRGDLVGYSGQTGWSCGPHLHFQVQRSPANGGGPGFYNPSIRDYFYDPGFAFDPAPGTLVTSKNGVSNQPRQELGDALEVDFHGGAGRAWDLAMREASAASVR